MNPTDAENDRPLPELEELTVGDDPSLAGRVQRDINRRTLAANSLEFSFTVMTATIWEHLRSLIDSWPSAGQTKDNNHGK